MILLIHGKLNFDKKEIKTAYKKLKSYIYYDKTLNVLRREIAKFESNNNLENKFKEIADRLNNLNSKKKFNEFLDKNKIDKILMPKNIKIENKFFNDSNENFITNDFEAENYKINRVKYLIDTTIEIHIISVLWIMKVGYKLEDDFSKHSYGYTLERTNENDSKVSEGLKLFKPYFYQYQNWRDNALDTAQSLTNRGKDTVILGLDIKGYFDNVRLKFSNLKSEIRNKHNTEERPEVYILTELLERIYTRYSYNFSDKNDNNSKEGVPLAIGLLSSSVLANWYLKEFDQSIIKELNPAYYGRYVDDILIVLSSPNIKTNGNSKNEVKIEQEIINKYLCKNKILEECDANNDCKVNESNTDNIQYKIIVKDEDDTNRYNNLYIQNQKISLYYLKADSSQAILENFKENIRQNSSEFRFLPENHKVENEFKFEAHSMLYDDSVNKLNSLKAFQHNKYKASVYLSKKIYASRLWDKDSKDAKNTADQIMKFFKGKVCLEFYILWEKVFTYFILKGMKEEFLEFYFYVTSLINKINISAGNDNNIKGDVNDVKKSLGKHLSVSASIPLSLNPDFLDNELKKDLKKKIDFIDNYELEKVALNIRRTNLMRHDIIFTPLINYTKLVSKNKKISLIEKNLHNYEWDKIVNEEDSSNRSLEFDEKLIEYSPRFIKLNEMNNYFIIKKLFNGKNKSKDTDVLDKYLIDSFEQFKNVNKKLGIHVRDSDNYFKMSINGEEVTVKDYNNKKDKLINSESKLQYINSSTKKFKINELKIFDKESREKLNIGVANIKLSEDDFKKSYKKNYNLSSKRKEKLFKILNLSYTEKVNGNDLDIIILPEVSVPPAWLPLLSDYSRRHQKAIVCGLEHFISSADIAYNLIVTILPFKIDDYKYSIVKVRIKNHYSPEEIEQLKGNHLKVPDTKYWNYDKFIWRGVHFACYNCYELADIAHRSIFKSKVDLLIASVYNKDVNYFSNIVESVSRDVHCYFIQVNSSNFGDTRVTQPTKTAVKDIMRFKGGENPAILATSIDLKKLRNFQYVGYNLQKTNDDPLKYTPPDFDRDEVRKRMQDFNNN